MGRPSKTDKAAEIDYNGSNDLTNLLLGCAVCPPELPFVLVRDKLEKGLRLRVTKAGGKYWQFEARIKGKLFTRSLGEWPGVPIGDAQIEANHLRGLAKKGTDPRDLERQEQEAKAAADDAAAAAQAAKDQQKALEALTVGEVWHKYIEARRARWGALHLADHIRLSAAGGVERKRGEGLTMPGPLHPLMSVRLVNLSASKVTAWAEREALTRPTPARLAWRLLRAFLTWCSEHSVTDPDTNEVTLPFAPLLPSLNAAKTKKTREALGKAGTKKDVLQREQLAAWFAAVRQIGNPAIAAYLQAMLLTGTRPGELLSLRWGNVNLAWRGLTIHDKVEGERVIPLTSYVHHLIAALPRRGEWVFAGAGEDALTRPAKNLANACTVAGVGHVSLHGLRRSFKSLTEWLEVPVGVVAQIQGHKPSATAEKHYTVRPLELLRLHHEKIESWILEQAGVKFDANTAPSALRVVAA